MKPDYLQELANLADPDKLWELGPFEALTLSKEKRVQLHTGIALRRYASHLKLLETLLESGQSVLITPLSFAGTATKIVATPEDHEMLRQGRHYTNDLKVPTSQPYEERIQCWCCGLMMTLKERSAEDGLCPKCHAEIELD